MVKRFLLLLILPLLLSSCAFFGSSAFPLAESFDLSGFINSGNIRGFFILNNGEDDPLLVLINEDGNYRALIFDTSLNLRGYMENGVNGAFIDNTAYVDHNGDFVIGQTKISRLGTAESGDIEFVPVPNLGNNISVFPYSDGTNDYYVRIDDTGNIFSYESDWTARTSQPLITLFQIPQSPISLNDVKMAVKTPDIEVYGLTKEALFNHAENNPLISGPTPELTITDEGYTEWVTRCSKGYFISQYSGDLVLLNQSGETIERIDNDEIQGEVVTIDYDCKYYYVLDWDDKVIKKLRFPGE